ncbi:MAG: hypothetical protein NCW75_00410 [Phycisphaera sp.]|nr:MAG: hypothetical protein NCW75_00410 [Phycisphaera sp.]
MNENQFWVAMLRIAKSRIKKNARPHLEKSICALRLTIDTFNASSAHLRMDTVLVQLHWAFEQLLKASLIQYGEPIKESSREQTISFDRASKIAHTKDSAKFISYQDWKYLQWLKNVRGGAYHDLVVLDEAELYLLAKTGVELFDKVLDDVFFERLADRIESRVLPICTVPLVDIGVLLDRKRSQIYALSKAGEAQAARNAARSLADLELVLGQDRPEDELLPGARKKQVDAIVRAVDRQEPLEDHLPMCSAIQITMEGTGPTLSVSLVGKKNPGVSGIEVDGSAPAVAYRRINPADDFQLTHTQVAQKLKISTSVLTGIMRELNVHDDESMCYRHGPAGSGMKQVGFHHKVLDKVRRFLAEHPDEDPLTWYRIHVSTNKKHRQR